MKDIRTFMAEHKALICEEQLQGLCDDFIADMTAGLGDKPVSLRMIPTYLSADKELESGKTVIALDIGGTNLRVALVELDENFETNILYIEKYPTPGRDGAVSTEEFFDLVVDYLLPVIDKSSDIGLCFSFPCEILPNCDGKILLFNKEIEVPDAPNKIIGDELRAALARKNLKNDHTISVINDTASAMLSAKVTQKGRVFSDYIGYILGTGTNSCYSEKCENVLKSEFLRQKTGKTIINIESGGFSGVPLGDIDRVFIDKTAVPTEHHFEKIASGAYQGDLALLYLKVAGLNGCFDDEMAEKIKELSEITAEDISVFLDEEYSQSRIDVLCGENKNARESMKELFSLILDRAAALTCVSITAIMEKADSGKNPQEPVCLLADGSVIRYSGVFLERFKHYNKVFTIDKKKRYFDICFADNATLLGTAVAAMLR